MICTKDFKDKCDIMEFGFEEYEGSEARIFRASDKKGESCLIRVQDISGNESKFDKEAKILEKVNGLGIMPKMIKYWKCNGQGFIVVKDWCYGAKKCITFQEIWKNFDKLSLKEKEKILDKILELFKKLHKAGIVHGDVHFDNILCRDGQFALIDFGKAEYMTSENRRDLMLKDIYNLAVYFDNEKGIGRELWTKKVNEYFKDFLSY